MADALRTTYWVPQMGSKLARSACGTKRSARAAARCEMAGVARAPATERAPASTTDFRNARRSMIGTPLCGFPVAPASNFRTEMRPVPVKWAQRTFARGRRYRKDVAPFAQDATRRSFPFKKQLLLQCT